MANEKEKTEVRREQIARAALDVMARRGVRGLSVAALARSVGLVPSAIYRHFPSKDHVLDLVLDQLREHLLANVEAVQAERADALEALHALLRRHVKLLRENQAIPLLVFSDQIYSGRAERKTKMHAILQSYLAAVGDLIRAGQQARSIQSGVDPAVAAVLFLGLVQPAAILWHLSEGGFDVTRQAERAWRIFAKAMRRP
ncbi:MAG: TetR/AcrR family transcriptional regulator [Verrucomicrobia bacterium]|nr:TetR/AcrR family transcriptional regulator [Verrucomicrobiota bacterium]